MKRLVITLEMLLVSLIGWSQELGFSQLVATGDSLLATFNVSGALQCYEQASQFSLNDSLRTRMAECYFRRGNYRVCIQLLEACDETQLSHTSQRHLYYSYQRVGEVEQMFRTGQAICQSYPFDGEILADMAKNYNAQEKADSAIILTTLYTMRDTTDLNVLKQFADAHFLKMNFDLAKTSYLSLIYQGDSLNYDVNFSLGMCYFQEEKYEEAYCYLKKAVDISKYQREGPLYRLGIACVKSGRYDEGISYLEQTLALISPSKQLQFYIYQAMSEGFEQKSDWDNCIKALLRCKQYDYEDVGIRFRLANAYEQKDDIVNAYYAYDDFLDFVHRKEDLKQTDELWRMVNWVELHLADLKVRYDQIP